MMAERLRSRDPNSNTNKCYTIYFEDEQKDDDDKHCLRKSNSGRLTKSTSPRQKKDTTHHHHQHQKNNNNSENVSITSHIKDNDHHHHHSHHHETGDSEIVVEKCDDKLKESEIVLSSKTTENNKDEVNLIEIDGERKRKFENLIGHHKEMETNNNNENNILENKRVKYDTQRDNMFEGYQPWVIQTYGDTAKTKTITLRKQARIIKALSGQESNNPDSSKFRFWVKAKGFTIERPADFKGDLELNEDLMINSKNCCLLYVPNFTKDASPHQFRKVAIVELFFDIIFGVHVGLGGRSGRHAGQKRTYRTITESYAFLPREAVTKFLAGCTVCKKLPQPYSPLRLDGTCTESSTEYDSPRHLSQSLINSSQMYLQALEKQKTSTIVGATNNNNNKNATVSSHQETITTTTTTATTTTSIEQLKQEQQDGADDVVKLSIDWEEKIAIENTKLKQKQIEEDNEKQKKLVENSNVQNIQLANLDNKYPLLLDMNLSNQNLTGNELYNYYQLLKAYYENTIALKKMTNFGSPIISPDMTIGRTGDVDYLQDKMKNVKKTDLSIIRKIRPSQSEAIVDLQFSKSMPLEINPTTIALTEATTNNSANNISQPPSSEITSTDNDSKSFIINSVGVSINVSNNSKINEFKISCKTTPPKKRYNKYDANELLIRCAPSGDTSSSSKAVPITLETKENNHITRIREKGKQILSGALEKDVIREKQKPQQQQPLPISESGLIRDNWRSAALQMTMTNSPMLGHQLSSDNNNGIGNFVSEPITSTYLKMTRSLGLSDEDALRIDDLMEPLTSNSEATDSQQLEDPYTGLMKDADKLKLMLLAWNYQNSNAVRNGTEGPDLGMVGGLWAQYQNALAMNGKQLSPINRIDHSSPVENQDETNSSGQKDDDDVSEDDSEDRLDQNAQDPERLKAFNMFVRLFVDENLDRMIPISKQPKEKIQAIIDSCTRQFPEFAERSRKRIRTYLKSCRRNKKTRDGWENTSRPTPAHLTSVQAEQILALACENESLNAKRMRLGLEPISQNVTPSLNASLDTTPAAYPGLKSTMESEIIHTPTVPSLAKTIPSTTVTDSSKPSVSVGNVSQNGNGISTNYRSDFNTTSFNTRSPSNYQNFFNNPLASPAANTTNGGPTDLSMKQQRPPLLSHKLNTAEINAVRQLVTGYRESAAFLLRSADELEQLLLQQQQQ